MPFTQSTILSVARPEATAGELHLSWTSSAPAGTWFQVYVARALAWHGRSTYCSIPTPADRARIDVGSVADGEQAVDFAASLPPAPSDRAELRWFGGRYQAADLASYRIYGEPSPGAGVSYARPLAEVAAYPGGIVVDGWNRGKCNRGGWGSAASEYRWTSPPLGNGTWTFAVASVDAAGNEGPAVLGSVAIVAPPRPPATFADGSRLHYAYDPATSTVTLSWNPPQA